MAGPRCAGIGGNIVCHRAEACSAGATGSNCKPGGTIARRRPSATCSCRYRHSLIGVGAGCKRRAGRGDGLSAGAGTDAAHGLREKDAQIAYLGVLGGATCRFGKSKIYLVQGGVIY